MSLKGKYIFWVVAILGTALDLWSKSYVFHLVDEHGGRIPVIEGFFYLSHAENPGGVFGIFPEHGEILTIIRGLALFVIVYALLKTESAHRLVIWALGCLFAGAAGNLYDNISPAYSHRVRDFLDFYLLPPNRWQFATFNIADVLINVGVGLLILHEIKMSRAKKAAETRPVSS